MYGPAKVKIKGKQLHITLLPAAQTFTGPLKHWHHNTFKVDFKDDFLPFALINFHLNAYGQVKNFTINLPNPDFHFHNLNFQKVN